MRRLLACLLCAAVPASAGPGAAPRVLLARPTGPAVLPALTLATPAASPPGMGLTASLSPALSVPALAPLPTAAAPFASAPSPALGPAPEPTASFAAPALAPSPALAAAAPAEAPAPGAAPQAPDSTPADAVVAGKSVSTRRSFAALRRLFGAKEGPDAYAGSPARLEAGERVYAPEPASQALDAATAHDLHLLGADGLQGRVDKAATAFGSARLHWLLTHPSFDAADIAARQAAAKELAADGAARASVSASFARHAGPLDRRLAEGVQGRVEHRSWVVFGLTNVLGALFQGVLALILLGPQPLQAVQLLFGYLLLLAQPIGELRARRADLLRYKAAVSLARELAPALSASSSDKLREIGAVFSAVSDPAHPLKLAKAAGSLSRMGGMKATLLYDYVLLMGPRTLWRPWSLVAEARERLAVLLGAVGELDAYRTLAELSREKGWGVFPAVAAEGPLRIADGHHPLVLARRGEASVANDAALGGESRFTVLTGANMGGKSTFLRMLGQLQVLAQMGAPVPAGAMETAVREIVSSIDISDDLKAGKSLYDAETDRILEIVRRAEGSSRLLVIMDEVLQGTNPDDRIAIERAVVRYLARTGNLFLLATHNLTIAELEGVVPGLANVHVSETVADGKMTFSHKVLPGPATSRNAITTLEMKGYPAEIVTQARADAAAR